MIDGPEVTDEELNVLDETVPPAGMELVVEGLRRYARRIRRLESHGVWLPGWPTQPGYYWFYGYAHGMKRQDEKPRLEMIQVKQISNGLAFISSGAFIGESQCTGGVWQPMIVPALPETFAADWG